MSDNISPADVAPEMTTPPLGTSRSNSSNGEPQATSSSSSPRTHHNSCLKKRSDVKLTELSAPLTNNEDDRPGLDAAESSWDSVVHSAPPPIHDTTMSSTTVAQPPLQPPPLPPVFPEQPAVTIGAFAVGGMNNNHDSWNDHNIDDEDNDNDDNEMALVPPSAHTAEVQVEAYIVVEDEEEEEEGPETERSRTAELEQQILIMSQELAMLRAQNAAILERQTVVQAIGVEIDTHHMSSDGNRSSGANIVRSGFEPPLQEYKRPESPPGSQMWRSLSLICTFFVPDACVPKEGAGLKQAWREKVTICLMAILLSAFMVGGIGFLPVYFCRDRPSRDTLNQKYTQEEIGKQSSETWITIFGKIYDMRSYINQHPGGQQAILGFLGNDASRIFPRLPLRHLPDFCLDTNKVDFLDTHKTPSCPEMTNNDVLVDKMPCHTTVAGVSAVYNKFKKDKVGDLVVPRWDLDKHSMQYIVIDLVVYNITQYMDGLIDSKTGIMTSNPDHPAAYLHPELHRLLMLRRNADATSEYHMFFDTERFLRHCMDELFYHSRIDDRNDPVCGGIGVLMYFFLFFVTGMLVIQVVCSLLYVRPSHRTLTDEDLQAAVMVMIPCYNERKAELVKTINSVINTTYPEENKLIVVVADGVVTGVGDRLSTPELVARTLGFEMDFESDVAYHYRSLGRQRDNYASVYAGVYTKEFRNVEKSIKYVVVVKRGAPEERVPGGRPGHRGKRDSQLVLAGMFNRIHYNREPSELDVALVKALFSLGMTAKDIKYLISIDAGTRVEPESMSHLVYAMEQDKKILACCGETQVDNKAQTWVTMIQVFEYYSNHLKRVFESVFGCVTCLPGCFTMYRVMTEDMKCLLADDRVYQDYSRNDIPSLHEKNLFELGDDRMLTTLLLQHFAGMHLSYVPQAICWTAVPHTMWTLLRQRRRWINSTFHNMCELMKVQTMYVFCMSSMKMVVIMNLIVTMILPASLIYLGYLAWLFISQPELIDRFILIFCGVSFSLQMISFLIRSRWDYLWWFLVFCIGGIPVFYFILPIYAFVNMDDFSMGKTRQVGIASRRERREVIWRRRWMGK